MVGYFDFRVAGRLHLYFRSRQVMPQYFFALTLPIQLPPADDYSRAGGLGGLYR
jgi:hypothetical protein